jgi:hypothetical protein
MEYALGTYPFNAIPRPGLPGASFSAYTEELAVVLLKK